MTGCLHLKSAVTALDDERLLVNRAWLDTAPFRGLELVDVAPEEPGAANVLESRGSSSPIPAFRARSTASRRSATTLRPLDISEFLKAEAALTCKSLLFAA